MTEADILAGVASAQPATAAELANHLDRLLSATPGGTGREAILGLLRPLAISWDLMPVPHGWPGMRIIVHSGEGTCRRTDFVLVDRSGHAYVEGIVPDDPLRRASYLRLRTLFLEANERRAASRSRRSASAETLIDALLGDVFARIRDDEPTRH